MPFALQRNDLRKLDRNIGKIQIWAIEQTKTHIKIHNQISVQTYDRDHWGFHVYIRWLFLRSGVVVGIACGSQMWDHGWDYLWGCLCYRLQNSLLSISQLSSKNLFFENVISIYCKIRRNLKQQIWIIAYITRKCVHWFRISLV